MLSAGGGARRTMTGGGACPTTYERLSLLRAPVKVIDVTLPAPAENLACDEALLDLCENERVEILRFWEAREHFVVVGYGNRIESEVNVPECQRRGVPILRRCSGGGTVVQGPGCLNYAVTLRVPDDGGPLASVTGTNEFVMERNRAAIEQLLAMEVSVQGHTDLAIPALTLPHTPALTPSDGDSEGKSRSKSMSKSGWLKFSGNAQRRRRHSILFHGTILYAFDLPLIGALLRFPSAQPEYRGSRSHREFIQNIPSSVERIRERMRSAWEADGTLAEAPRVRIDQLIREQYGQPLWNERR
jgi:lipoate---protein ligase